MNMADQKNLLRGEPRRNEPMARHTSWRAGGTADRAYVPVDLEDMRLFLAALPRAEPVHVVGLGSNLLVRDGGLRGTVIFTHGALKEIRSEGNAIYAESGVPSPVRPRTLSRSDSTTNEATTATASPSQKVRGVTSLEAWSRKIAKPVRTPHAPVNAQMATVKRRAARASCRAS